MTETADQPVHTTTTENPADRRRFPRHPIDAWVHVAWPDGRRSHHFTKDVSGCGIFVIADKAPEAGTEVAVELVIDDEFCFKTIGTVVRSVEMATEVVDREQPALPGFAIRFHHLVPHRAEQLIDLLDMALERIADERQAFAYPG